MPKRTPDIFLTPSQLIGRARAARAEAECLQGEAHRKRLAEASSDETMANLKRLAGDRDDEAPSFR